MVKHGMTQNKKEVDSMPELPEVETVKKTLKALVIGETISEVVINWPKIIKEPTDTELFKDKIDNQTILDIKRKGKFLLFELSDYTLVSHLRMEGKYGVFPHTDPFDKHTHIIFNFKSGKSLRYHDVRKFGTMHLYKKGHEMEVPPLNQLGPDPFESEYHLETIYPRVKSSKRVIKNILLDQNIIAGLGNIYVDETLYRAKIHPLRPGDSLSEEEVKTIMAEAEKTLSQAIEQGGTTIRSYVNSQGQIGMFQQQLFAYGQEDQPCKRCGQPIIKIKVSNRGTHYCRTCQSN